MEREAHQRRLNEMLEETLRQIQRTRAHSQQKSKHVRESTKSYVARFEHDMSCVNEELRRELVERTKRIDGILDGLSVHMDELESDMEKQRQVRIVLIEEKLGPIRDDMKWLVDALERERRARRLEEEVREKMYTDQVESITKLIDEEKFDREQQLVWLEKQADEEQQHLAKRQYQIEKERQDTVMTIRSELEAATKERVRRQADIAHSIATFVKRYRHQVGREIEVNELTVGHGVKSDGHKVRVFGADD